MNTSANSLSAGAGSLSRPSGERRSIPCPALAFMARTAFRMSSAPTGSSGSCCARALIAPRTC
eukprot:68804-Pyramimonas_sp.AAC.1